MTELGDPGRLLEQLEEEERLLSKRRARLHQRLEYARTSGDGAGNPAPQEQIEALEVQERELSKTRKDLHRRIDELRADRERRQAPTHLHDQGNP